MTKIAPLLLTITVFVCTLALYWRTAAPSVLSGDSAEFQLAAATLGVPHPTTYPLYTLVGHLATRLIPSSDVARRVTLASAVCAALAAAVFFWMARRAAGGWRGALVAALALGVTPGLWNAATLAEVYALLALLLALALLALLGREPGVPPAAPLALGLIAGLGCTHHGLFVIAMLPPLLLGARPFAPQRLLGFGLGFALGLTPWLYPAIQFARYGPFNGLDYGLPQMYFWGAPQSWGALADLLSGGAIRRGIFQIPTSGEALAVLTMVAGRLGFEFGPVGVTFGLVGLAALLRRRERDDALFASGWAAAANLGYLLLLGPAVEDAPVFTLPLLLPWALWLAFGVETLLGIFDSGGLKPAARNDHALPGIRAHSRLSVDNLPVGRRTTQIALTTLLIAATLAWGRSRVPYTNKRDQWLFRTFGEATLSAVTPGAAVMAHWEQGMALQYLSRVEGVRRDVFVDVVEPGDEAWAARAARRYRGRAVYLVGSPADVVGLPVVLVRADPYANLYRLER